MTAGYPGGDSDVDPRASQATRRGLASLGAGLASLGTGQRVGLGLLAIASAAGMIAWTYRAAPVVARGVAQGVSRGVATVEAPVRASQNGWPASPDPTVIDVVTVSVPLSDGRKLKMNVARSVAPQLVSMVQWWNDHVEPVTTLGSYNFRKIRGYENKVGNVSNHGSGTAIDINADWHPLGAYGTVPANLRGAIRAQAASLGLRWGGDFSHRKDEMHVEVA